MPIIDLGRRGWVTRDCPNVIIAPLASVRGLSGTYLASSWGGYPANYGQIIASTAAEYVITHAFLCAGLGTNIYADATAYMLNHMHLLIGKGAAGSEAVIAEVMTTSSVNLSLVGVIDDVVTCSLVEKITHTVPLAPVIVPAGSRLGVKGQVSGAPALKKGGIYLTGYPTAAFDFANVPPFDELFMRGCRPAYSDIDVILSPTTVTAAGYWVPGTWIQIGATLDEDYLYDQGTALATAATSSAAQFEVGIGPDNTHVVEQARYALAIQAYAGAADDEFPKPFIAYKGENVWVRVADEAGTNKDYTVCLHRERLA